jgi:hypothetical protein
MYIGKDFLETYVRATVVLLALATLEEVAQILLLLSLCDVTQVGQGWSLCRFFKSKYFHRLNLGKSYFIGTINVCRDMG